ncbi:MAG TPA: NADH-quinone oxidoreductase subunit J [Acidimicrobiales bacterium]|nr:NADH-quinone oxidoreductase subunit J [Acidimicrobiales bacterium]
MPGALFASIVQLAAATRVDAAVFAAAALCILAGAIGVVVARNPVHAALMLVLTLFGVAVLFVEQQANFLAAVQVIVYAGAIVVLFLFVIMFLGVDRRENVALEPLRAQRPLAVALVALGLAGLLVLGIAAHWSVGAHSVAGAQSGQSGGDVAALGRSVFTTYLFPFEITAALLVIAVVGAVVLARRPQRLRRAGPPPSLVSGPQPGPAGDGGEGEPSGALVSVPARAAVGDPMVALAEAVAHAVSSGTSHPADGGGEQAGAALGDSPDDDPGAERRPV